MKVGVWRRISGPGAWTDTGNSGPPFRGGLHGSREYDAPGTQSVRLPRYRRERRLVIPPAWKFALQDSSRTPPTASSPTVATRRHSDSRLDTTLTVLPLSRSAGSPRSPRLRLPASPARDAAGSPAAGSNSPNGSFGRYKFQHEPIFPIRTSDSRWGHIRGMAVIRPVGSK